MSDLIGLDSVYDQLCRYSMAGMRFLRGQFRAKSRKADRKRDFDTNLYEIPL